MGKILVVDDQEDNVELLSQVLEDQDYEVVTAYNGEDAVAAAEKEKPDVILLDIQMPVMNGLDACKVLKGKDATRDIPIIFLTAQTGEESVVEGLSAGAYDYVTKPFNEKELLSRVSVMLRIKSADKAAKEMAVTDSLTGLYNRRYLMDRFTQEISRAERKHISLGCLMMDIDLFKNINDSHGHDVGDYVIKKVAEVAKGVIREYDTLVRYGGEEFFALLPGESMEGARKVAEKIRTTIEEHNFTMNNHKLHVTLSLGVYASDYPEIDKDPDMYIKLADNALYAAKNAGRNKTIVYDTGLENDA